MKLVFVTQVLDRDDAVLGFVMRWVQGLAKHVESVRVLALEAGNLAGLPANVDVRVIGRRGYVGRYLRYRRFLRDAFGPPPRSGPSSGPSSGPNSGPNSGPSNGVNGGFDGLLTHMVPRYSTLAAGLAAKAGVAHYLWYTHKLSLIHI